MTTAGTIRGSVGGNIAAAFAVGVIGLLPPPPHWKKRRKAVATTTAAAVVVVGASSPLVPIYLRTNARTHAHARSRDQKDESERPRLPLQPPPPPPPPRRSVWMGRCSHARSLCSRNSGRSVGSSIRRSVSRPVFRFRVVQSRHCKLQNVARP